MVLVPVVPASGSATLLVSVMRSACREVVPTETASSREVVPTKTASSHTRIRPSYPGQWSSTCRRLSPLLPSPSRHLHHLRTSIRNADLHCLLCTIVGEPRGTGRLDTFGSELGLQSPNDCVHEEREEDWGFRATLIDTTVTVTPSLLSIDLQQVDCQVGTELLQHHYELVWYSMLGQLLPQKLPIDGIVSLLERDR